MSKRLFLGSLILPMSLAANWFYPGYNGWIAGEALLLRPVANPFYYTIIGPIDTNNNQPVGNQLATTPSYIWGFRVELGGRRCSNDVRLAWTGLNTGQSTRVQAAASERLWLTVKHPDLAVDFIVGGAAFVHESLQYNVLDGDIGHWSCVAQRSLSGRVFAGVRYARNSIAYQVDYLDVANAGSDNEYTRLRSDTQGIGPRIGVSGDYHLCWGLRLSGELSGELLIGSVKSFWGYRELDGGVADDDFTQVHNRSASVIFPGAEVKFGVGICRAVCGIELSGGVGYEISYYSDGQQQTVFVDSDRENVNQTNTRPFTVDGWYFRLGAQF